jgi:hypothetical protein
MIDGSDQSLDEQQSQPTNPISVEPGPAQARRLLLVGCGHLVAADRDLARTSRTVCSALGISVTDGSQLDDTLDTAAAHDAPALIAVVTDPDLSWPRA